MVGYKAHLFFIILTLTLICWKRVKITPKATFFAALSLPLRIN